jgi:beta-lactamase superfamily II metal-dependent hydrolase
MASGIQKLDGLLMTKTDAAHAGGFKTLIRHVGIRDAWIPYDSDEKKRNRYVSSVARRVRITPLSEGDRIQIGSNQEIYLEILALEKGEIGAFLISDGSHKMLYLSSNKEKMYQTLLSRSSVQYEVVFLPHHESGISNLEKKFLENLSTHYLVLNQRDRSPIRSEIESYSRASLLSISELGAVEFWFKDKEVIYQTFLKS